MKAIFYHVHDVFKYQNIQINDNVIPTALHSYTTGKTSSEIFQFYCTGYIVIVNGTNLAFIICATIEANASIPQDPQGSACGDTF